MLYLSVKYKINMRKEIITLDSIVHIINRGNKKMPIYRQKSDLWRMLFGLFYTNTNQSSQNWMKKLEIEKIDPQSFIWPDKFGEKNPIVSVLGFVIMQNHFHLILKEIIEGGISGFMHKFSMGYSKFINAKYKESGSLFQSRFQSRTIETDGYLQRVAVYVMVKNTFELYPKGGLAGATKNFESAWQWAIEYPFSSLADYCGKRNSPILNKDLLGEIFDSPKEFKEFSEEYILGRAMNDGNHEEFEF